MLATTSQASGNVRAVLRAALDVIRQAGDAAVPADLPFNEDERRAYEIFVTHLRQAWEAASGSAPTDVELRGLLRRCHVLVLDVEPGGSDETTARQLLRTLVVSQAAQADATWDALVELCARLAVDRFRRRRRTVERLTPNRSHAFFVEVAASRAERCSAITASTWSRCPRSRRAAPRARALFP